jgi:hypothetical protein
MYVNTEVFLSDAAVVRLEDGTEDNEAYISIIDGGYRTALYFNKSEADTLKFDTLTYHTVFYSPDGVAVFSKFENDQMAALRAQLETL